MKTEMTIDQKLEIIREAINGGAKINIYFHHLESREEGKKIIERMSELTGATIVERNDSDMFSLNHFESPVDCTVFYDLSKEEKKVKLLHELNRMNAEIEEGGKDIEQAN